MGTILPESSTFDPQIVSPNPGEDVRASDSAGIAYLIAGVDFNGGVIYVGSNPLARVRHLGGISMSLLVTVAGTDITVQLGTDGSGNVLSTANNVVTAFMANAMATALATASAQGTGASLAGINTVYLSLSQDVIGSVRPPFQHITNRTRYLYNKITGILAGTLSVKALTADGTGDLVVAPTPGNVTASNDMIASQDITAINGSIGAFNGDVFALAGNVQAITADVIAGNELNGDHLQVARDVGGTTLPNLTVPLGQGNVGNILYGWAHVDGSAAAPAYTNRGSLNVSTIAHTADGRYTITFKTSVTRYSAMVSAAFQFGSNGYHALTEDPAVSLNPLTLNVQVFDTAANDKDGVFTLWVVAE